MSVAITDYSSSRVCLSPYEGKTVAMYGVIGSVEFLEHAYTDQYRVLIYGPTIQCFEEDGKTKYFQYQHLNLFIDVSADEAQFFLENQHKGVGLIGTVCRYQRKSFDNKRVYQTAFALNNLSDVHHPTQGEFLCTVA